MSTLGSDISSVKEKLNDAAGAGAGEARRQQPGRDAELRPCELGAGAVRFVEIVEGQPLAFVRFGEIEPR